MTKLASGTNNKILPVSTSYTTMFELFVHWPVRYMYFAETAITNISMRN